MGKKQRHVQLIDTTLRDGQQSLWATRMTNEMFMPFIGKMDEMGYAAIDLVGGAVFDVCVRFLHENPWERMRLAAQQVTKTPLGVWTRGQSLFTFEFFADDIVALTIKRCAANGMGRISTYDSLNDIRNIEVTVATTKQCGMFVCANIVYTVSPVHTDQYYVEKILEILKLKPDGVGIKDPSGMLTPELAKTLIPSVRAVMGKIPLELHSHCRAGLGELVAIEAAALGVDVIYVATSPLSSGDSLPDARYVISNLNKLGYVLDVDIKDVELTEAYFSDIAAKYGKPVNGPNRYDPFLFHHQIPGGMISNLHSQLKEIELEDRFDEVLEEVGRVREDLGYPILVSPFAQFVVTQSVMNIAMGERYKVIPDEVQRYVLGYYGRPAGPINQRVLDRVCRGALQPMPVDERPGACVEPQIGTLRKLYGPFESDDDLLLACYYKPAQLTALKRGGDIASRSPSQAHSGSLSAAQMMTEIRRFPIQKSISVHRPGFSYRGEA